MFAFIRLFGFHLQNSRPCSNAMCNIKEQPENMPAKHTLFLERFMSIDFAYLQGNGELSAQSVFVSIEISGALDSNGFVIDFGDAKKLLKETIDNAVDHKCLVPETVRK